MEELPLITAYCCLYPLTEIALRPVINVFKLFFFFFLTSKGEGGGGGVPQELWENWLVCDEKSLYRELSRSRKGKISPCVPNWGPKEIPENIEISLTIGCATQVELWGWKKARRFYLWGWKTLEFISPVLVFSHKRQHLLLKNRGRKMPPAASVPTSTVALHHVINATCFREASTVKQM